MKRLMYQWLLVCVCFSSKAMNRTEDDQTFIPVSGFLSFTLMPPPKAERIADKALYFSSIARLYPEDIIRSHSGSCNFLEIPVNKHELEFLHALADIPTWDYGRIGELIRNYGLKIDVRNVAIAVQLFAYYFSNGSIEKVKIKCFDSPFGGKAWLPTQPLSGLGWVTIRFNRNQLFISQNYGNFYHVLDLDTGSMTSYPYKEEVKRSVLKPISKNQILDNKWAEKNGALKEPLVRFFRSVACQTP